MARTFLNSVLDIDASQLVDFATRDQNILDLVFSNSPSVVCDLERLPAFHTSDHCSIGFKISFGDYAVPLSLNPVKLLDFKNADLPDHDHEWLTVRPPKFDAEPSA
jgi:hypothetical protein